MIQWLGMSCFRIQTPAVTVILDPYKGSGELKTPRIVNADLILHSTLETIGNGPSEAFVISGPGEYEVKGVFCQGIPAGDVTVYLLELEGVRIALLGRLSVDLDNGVLELVEHADVLIVPVGGKTVLDGKTAATLCTRIEPRVILPSCFSTSDHPAPFESNSVFLKEMGVSSPAVVDKIKIDAKRLPTDTTEITVLSPQ